MKLYGWIGLLLLITSEYCLYHKIEPFSTWFYCFAWWSYILVADNLLLKFRGQSLLSGRLREFWKMLFLSIFIWLVFEVFNWRIQNWQYQVAGMPTWQRWIGYALSFATVLPGIFITSDLVEIGLFGRSKKPAASECPELSGEQTSPPSLSFIALGLVMTIAPLLWPRYFFFAVWLGPIILFDPLLEKANRQSLSLSIFSGDRKRVWSLLIGGLICGIMWEFWNYWAGSKWIYSIPFFGKGKLFEMPALGFLGFPPFALECWIFYHLLKAVPEHLDTKAARFAWWIGIGLLCLLIFNGMDRNTIIHQGLTRIN
jgi:hypothetical protein